MFNNHAPATGEHHASHPSLAFVLSRDHLVDAVFRLGIVEQLFSDLHLMALLIVGELFPAIALGYYGWRRCSRHPVRAWSSAMWIAFYMTVPLFAYDYLYLAVHQQRGWSFLQTHWYLSAFYVIPWVLLPPIAWWVTSRQRATR